MQIGQGLGLTEERQNGDLHKGRLEDRRSSETLDGGLLQEKRHEKASRDSGARADGENDATVLGGHQAMQRENIMCEEALLQIEILHQNVKNRASYPPTIEILASQRREAVEEESQGRPP